jgi:glycosyltransferase involved in cell wall biosynthesis
MFLFDCQSLPSNRTCAPRVLVLTTDYPPNSWSGIATAVHRQVSDLRTLGVSIELIIIRPSYKSTTTTVDHLPQSFPSGRYDWIHLHSLPLVELALDLRRSAKVRLAYTVHTLPWLELEDHRLRRFWLDMQSRLLERCDRVVFLSGSELAAARALFPNLPPATVIGNGVPDSPAMICPWEDRNGVLFVGRFAASKGIALLEQTVERLARQSDIRFRILGGHADVDSQLIIDRLARRFPRRCEFLGWRTREEVDELMASSRLVLVPSRYEPFGLVALEAMRMGTPVLASNVGGLREIATEASGALAISTRDPGVWAAEALRVVSDRALWAKLHGQGPRFVNRHYSSREIASRLLSEVYALSGVAAGAVIPI